MQFKIPNTFDVLGRHWKVEFKKDLYKESEPILGKVDYSENIIYIQEPTEEYLLLPDNLFGIFLHELMHIIFYSLGLDEECDDESLVESIAGCLHQVINTHK